MAPTNKQFHQQQPQCCSTKEEGKWEIVEGTCWLIDISISPARFGANFHLPTASQSEKNSTFHSNLYTKIIIIVTPSKHLFYDLIMVEHHIKVAMMISTNISL